MEKNVCVVCSYTNIHTCIHSTSLRRVIKSRSKYRSSLDPRHQVQQAWL